MASNQQDRSSLWRARTAIIQGGCGVVAIACGITLFPLRADDSSYLPYPARLPGIANIGFGIWGGVIIAAAAVLGCIYRNKKAMISVYAAFSLVGMAVAVILFSVAVVGLSRFARLDPPNCQYLYYQYLYDEYDEPPVCCLHRYYCDVYDYQSSLRYDPYEDYDSEECQYVREEESNCRDEIREAKFANLSLFAILLLVSVVEFIASVTAAVLSLTEVCRGCCQTPTQQVVYLVDPVSGQPGSVPMVFAPNMTPGSQQVTGVGPNTMTSPYPPQMTVLSPNMAPGLYPYPMPAVNQPYSTGPQGAPNNPVANQVHFTTPPPPYVQFPGNI